MNLSKHTIFSKIQNSDNYYLVNLLTGNADIIDSGEAELIKNNALSQSTYFDMYKSKGYLMDKENEASLYQEKYKKFLEIQNDSEIQIFFVPTYKCNFNCTYCFQAEYTNQKTKCSDEIINSFYKYIDKNFKNKNKYITIFGGEPLLQDSSSGQAVQKLLEGAAERQLDTAIVTNGYTLHTYIDLLAEYKIREIQVTLDGTEDIHNLRRKLKNQKGTFKQISDNINLLLQHKINVNLRMVIDKENINDLPSFADYAIKQGWTKSQYFKTQFGRNYELHYCQNENSKLYSRIALYEDLYKLIITHPQILEFHKPAFSISRFLFDNGKLPEALFDSCPGCKTEWAFDYTGKIYSCTATVGKPDEDIGSFYPEESHKSEIIKKWQNRNVTAIPQCRDCSLQLACGGGCASVAKNDTGNILNPDCRPVKELLEYGIDLYFEKGVCNV